MTPWPPSDFGFNFCPFGLCDDPTLTFASSTHPSVRVNCGLLDYDKRHDNALPQIRLVLVSLFGARPLKLVLVLSVGSAHMKSVSPLDCLPRYVMLPSPVPPNIISEIADVLVENERRNRYFAQEPKHGSGKDETGMSLARRRRSLISLSRVSGRKANMSW